MFNAKTFPLKFAAGNHVERIACLEKLLGDQTVVYIDYGNVRGWKKRLGWEIDLLKLKDFFDSFGVREVRFYFGTIPGDRGSEKFMTFVHKLGYKVRTKRLKRISVSIDVSSIKRASRDILGGIIDQALLHHLPTRAIEALNDELGAMNRRGVMAIEFWKCNFDVEIASDMRIDHHLERATSFCLISGDSDFADPLTELINDHRPTTVIGTARHIASEINALQSKGLKIFDIKTLRDFVAKTE